MSLEIAREDVQEHNQVFPHSAFRGQPLGHEHPIR